ncbi:hypothetical protein C3L33_12173, partial [Rhododendron williamsianum]
MLTSATPGILAATTKPCAYSSCRVSKPGTAIFISSWARLNCSSQISSAPFFRNFPIISAKPRKFVTKAMSEASNISPLPGLPIDLRGKRAFIAGVADDNGYGWAIAKSLAAAGAEILVGTWVPALNIFESSLRRGKFDESRTLRDGSLMEITKVYPLDAVYDFPEDVPEDVKTNKRYAGSSNWTVKEVAECVKQDFGSIDILVHSLANGPEVGKPILETSRNGYLAAISAYGGGMSTAKAALESDTRMLAFEAGRKHQIRVNSISAGPLKSRAAKAIGSKEEVGDTAAFLASPLASAITGAVIYVDNGLNAMGMGVDSPVFADFDIPRSIPKST